MNDESHAWSNSLMAAPAGNDVCCEPCALVEVAQQVHFHNAIYVTTVLYHWLLPVMAAGAMAVDGVSVCSRHTST